MLNTMFLTCAVLGGALVLAQVMLSVFAIGAGHGLHLHHWHGGSATPHRLTAIRGHRVGSGRGAARGVSRGAAKTGLPKGSSASAHVVSPGRVALAWVLSMFNFQGVVAGATVFGLAGLAATAAKISMWPALAIAFAAAFAMMAVVDGVFTLMANMESDGTIDLQQAVGKAATVYLGIPAKNEGQGKITMSLQQRLMEFPAVTFKDAPLEAGRNVQVVAVVDGSVMLVVPSEDAAARAATGSMTN